MGFLSKFSRSSSKGHYRHGRHGSDYYKRRGSGILGKIIDALNGSRSHSHSHSHSHNYRRRHSHRSSWS
ncbi:MAG: hypothetical protein A4E52_01286 [Pelotomaculum sp. PtaB.Bin013]|nr:MAG: hypothetical protein A4E52_01286 [Pelotomaculum sp. PtaB.Bin013]